ncbi:hypothetical protein P171DRAFT_156933 [Karstenula rhodostoma CBS 690.94]|uniref:Uncharacterized protein n=1 Tax=Karstenula rhodostoma CBS 690.94 TaxID=1392251 RepID=A0A9P4P5M1_9PLEO|nr:hypothetical protein P171DRAFT_156933 [Karstenula rhodostoma CBS 690.94]
MGPNTQVPDGRTKSSSGIIISSQSTIFLNAVSWVDFKIFVADLLKHYKVQHVSAPFSSCASFHANSCQGLWSWNIIRAEDWTGPRPPNSPHRRLPRIDDKDLVTNISSSITRSVPGCPL